MVTTVYAVYVAMVLVFKLGPQTSLNVSILCRCLVSITAINISFTLDKLRNPSACQDDPEDIRSYLLYSVEWSSLYWHLLLI